MKKQMIIFLTALIIAVSLRAQGAVDRCAIGKYLSHAHALRSIKKEYPGFYKKFEKEVPFMIEGCQNGRHDLTKDAKSTLRKFYA